MTFAETLAKCSSRGLVMCEKSCAGTGCQYDVSYVWSGLTCDESQSAPISAEAAPAIAAIVEPADAAEAVVPTKADEAAATAQNAAVVAAKAAQAAAVAAVQQQVNTPTEEAPPDIILLAGHQLLTVQFADAAFPGVEATCYGTAKATARSLLIVGRHGERRSKPNQWKNCTAAPFPPTSSFPGHVLFLDFEPHGPLPRERIAKPNVVYLGPMPADSGRELRVVQGAAQAAVPAITELGEQAFISYRHTRPWTGKQFLAYAQVTSATLVVYTDCAHTCMSG